MLRHNFIRFIETTLTKTPQQLINLLVNKIVLFNDRIEITCNYTDKERPDGNRHRVFSIYYNHYSLSLNHDKFKRPFVNLEYDVSVFIWMHCQNALKITFFDWLFRKTWFLTKNKELSNLFRGSTESHLARREGFVRSEATE